MHKAKRPSASVEHKYKMIPSPHASAYMERGLLVFNIILPTAQKMHQISLPQWGQYFPLDSFSLPQCGQRLLNSRTAAHTSRMIQQAAAIYAALKTSSLPFSSCRPITPKSIKNRMSVITSPHAAILFILTDAFYGCSTVPRGSPAMTLRMFSGSARPNTRTIGMACSVSMAKAAVSITRRRRSSASA